MRSDVRIVGGAGDWLFGFDRDGTPVCWLPGSDPAIADPLSDYAGWHVGQFGFDRFWINSKGEKVEANEN